MKLLYVLEWWLISVIKYHYLTFCLWKCTCCIIWINSARETYLTVHASHNTRQRAHDSRSGCAVSCSSSATLILMQLLHPTYIGCTKSNYHDIYTSNTTTTIHRTILTTIFVRAYQPACTAHARCHPATRRSRSLHTFPVIGK